ncbi:uncharacterized protein LOC115736393 [Rhodamnia argentea]|uniref:Uncharacterized protein LOC115736393 n=1 Tax=Rhodamnia argentea TaxID=178133 RepID=A0A8B8NN61_9MYRT|nr:uncharacterized protein LOC115736393 [Rhodamnia argentea]
MALSNLKAPRIMAHKSGPVVMPLDRVPMLGNSQLPLRRATAMRIRSCLNNQVFEDRAEGIICYRDENGEIVCEGFDEGPRFRPKTARTEYRPRDAKIIDLLQRNWIQLVNGSQAYQADTGLSSREDFNWNGFNRFR